MPVSVGPYPILLAHSTGKILALHFTMSSHALQPFPTSFHEFLTRLFPLSSFDRHGSHQKHMHGA